MVVLSSWGDQIVDNRGKAPEAWQTVPRFESLQEFEPGNPILAVMGWDGVIILDERVDVVDMARAYVEKAQQESCGRCVPCSMGTRVVADALIRIADGRGVPEDLENIRRLAGFIQAGSKCELGRSSMVALLDLLDQYEAEFRRAIAEGKPRPRGNYHAKVTAPCVETCPERIDIPRYIELIRSARYGQSLSVIREKNPLAAVCGRVCVRFCESACRRGLLDDPLSIKNLKRFVADVEMDRAVKPKPEPVPAANGHRIAIIGAGPSGLTAAYRLAKQGYAVEIFESLDEPGGAAAVGIPDYRLPRAILRSEVEAIQKLGAQIHYGQRLGRDFTLQDLRDRGFAAIYVAIGAQDGRGLGVPGEVPGMVGYTPGLDFLRTISETGSFPVGERAVIVGGGNVAIDCARSALRLGVKEVTLVYRRGREEMPADKVEVRDAEAEGVRFELLCNPVRVLARDGRVVGVECVRMALGEPDASGRRSPVPVEGSEFVIETDMVIPAIGQGVDLTVLDEGIGLQSTRRGTVKADPHTLVTDAEGVFAGGDCVSGPATLIEAMAAGLRAASSIDQYLRDGQIVLSEDERLSAVVRQIGAFRKDEKVDRPGGRRRVHPPERPIDERVDDFDEVEAGITAAEALQEADRCLRCYRIILVATEKGTEDCEPDEQAEYAVNPMAAAQG